MSPTHLNFDFYRVDSQKTCQRFNGGYMLIAFALCYRQIHISTKSRYLTTTLSCTSLKTTVCQPLFTCSGALWIWSSMKCPFTILIHASVCQSVKPGMLYTLRHSLSQIFSPNRLFFHWSFVVFFYLTKSLFHLSQIFLSFLLYVLGLERYLG